MCVLLISCGDGAREQPLDMELVNDGEDASGSMDMTTDTGTDMSGDMPGFELDPSYVWPEIKNTCATLHSLDRVSPEKSAHLSVPGSFQMNLAWKKELSCQTLGDEGEYVRGMSTMFLSNVDGEEVIATTLDRVADSSAPGVAALVLMSSADGESVSCDGINTNYAPGGPVLSNPYTNEPVVFLRSYEDDFIYELSGFMARGAWMSPSWGEYAPVTLLPTGQYSTPTYKVLPDGQILAIYDSKIIVSLDGISGRMNWIVGPNELKAAMPDPGEPSFAVRSGQTEWDEARRAITVVVARRPDGTTTTVDINSCGEVSGGKTSGEAFRHIFSFNEKKIDLIYNEFDFNVSVTGAADALMVNGCGRLISVDDFTMACIHTSSTTTRLRYTVIDTIDDSATELEVNVSGDDPTVTTAHLGGLVSLREGSFLMSTYDVDESGETPVYEHALITVEWETGRIIERFPMSQIGEGEHMYAGMPLVNDEGRIIVARGDTMYAIDSQSAGLATGGFPRGYSLGGNDNAGTMW